MTCAAAAAKPVHCPFIVRIFEQVPAHKPYHDGYEREVWGFGKPTLAEAQSEAEKDIAFLTERFGRAHRAEFRLFCERCGAHGVEPGFKRKPCTACGGEGTTPIEGAPHAKENHP